jgi:hypothetical protein
VQDGFKDAFRTVWRGWADIRRMDVNRIIDHLSVSVGIGVRDVKRRWRIHVPR